MTDHYYKKLKHLLPKPKMDLAKPGDIVQEIYRGRGIVKKVDDFYGRICVVFDNTSYEEWYYDYIGCRYDRTGLYKNEPLLFFSTKEKFKNDIPEYNLEPDEKTRDDNKDERLPSGYVPKEMAPMSQDEWKQGGFG